MSQSPCPQCGAPNRAGARFCQRCRAPLSMPGATKPCPQCHTPNRLDAKFCAACRYEFMPPVGVGGRLGRLPVSNTVVAAGLAGAGALALMLLCALLIFFFRPENQIAAVTPAIVTATIMIASSNTPAIVPSATSVTTGTPRLTVTGTTVPTAHVATPSLTVDGLDRAKRGTVLIVVPMDLSGSSTTGTGSTITKLGHILTNYHLFVDDNGRPYSARGEITIWFPPRDNLKGEAEYRYRAVLIEKDVQKDLALLRIVARKDGSALPADLELGVIPIGDSDKVDSPDPITILGYPGVGKTTSLTVSTDIVAGFLQAEGYIKTNAEINPGNSGGPALNRVYEQIGVVSKVRVADASRGIPGKIGLIRPIKFAKPLIDLARREAGE